MHQLPDAQQATRRQGDSQWQRSIPPAAQLVDIPPWRGYSAASTVSSWDSSGCSALSIEDWTSNADDDDLSANWSASIMPAPGSFGWANHGFEKWEERGAPQFQYSEFCVDGTSRIEKIPNRFLPVFIGSGADPSCIKGGVPMSEITTDRLQHILLEAQPDFYED